MPVLRDLLPESYKKEAKPVAVWELTGVKPRCRTAVGSRWPRCEFSANRQEAAKGKTSASCLAARIVSDCTTLGDGPAGDRARGFSAESFENPLAEGAGWWCRRGGNFPRPGLPLGETGKGLPCRAVRVAARRSNATAHAGLRAMAICSAPRRAAEARPADDIKPRYRIAAAREPRDRQRGCSFG